MKYIDKIKVFLVLVLGLLAATAQAQDPHMSQFSSAPLMLNPAMSGVFQGSWRAGVNYRNQWASVIGPNPYRTIHASFEYKMQAVQRDYMTFGINLMNDMAGSGQYTLNTGMLSFSYLKEMAGNPRKGTASYIVLSAQAGIGQRRVNWDNLSYSAQFNGDVYDPNLPTLEPTGISGFIYPDFNAGMLWYGIFGERKSAYLGAALHHLNRPNISFFPEQNDFLNNKFTLHAGGELLMGKTVSIMPSLLGMFQGASTELMLGANLRYMNKDWNEVALRVGAWGRVVNKDESGFGTDALVVLAGIEFQRITLGVSYDVNSSTLVPASNRQGAIEVALYYTSEPKRRGELKCPKF